MLDASPRMVLGVLFVVLVASTDTTASRQNSDEPSVFFTLHLDTYDTPAPVSSFHPDAERLLPPPPPPAHTTASLDEEDAASPPPSVRAIVVDRVVSGAAGRDFLRNGDASALVVAPLSAARLDHSRTLDALNRSATLGGGALESADVYPPSFAQWRAGGLFEERHPKGESVLVAALDCGDRITDDAMDPVCLTRAHGTSLAAVVGREGKITATFGAATIVSDAELRTVDSQLFQARVERSNDAVAVSWLQVRAMLGIHEEVAFAFLTTGKRRVAAAAAAASDARQRSWGQQPATLLRNMADLVLPYVVLDDATLNHRAVDGVRTTPPPFADLTRSLGEGVASSNVFLSQQHSLDGFVGTTAKTAKELLSLCQDSGGIVVGVARRIGTAAAASTTGSELSVDDASHHVCEKRADNAEGTCNGGRATNGASLVLPVHELELAPVCIAHPEEGPLSPRQEARLSTWYAAVMRPYVSELRDPKQALLHRETDEARLHPQRFDRRAFVKHSSAHVVLVLSADHEVMGFVDDLKRWASPAPEPTCLAVLREASVLARWRLQQSSADDATLHHELRFDAAYFDASAHAQVAHWMTSWPATRQRAEEDEPAGSEVEYGEAGPCHFGALVRFAATPGRVAAGPVVRRTFCPRARTGDELLRCASSVLEWSRSWRRWTVDDDSDAMPRRIVGNLDRLRGGLTQDAHDWRRVTTGLRSLIGPDSGSALGFLIGPSDGCAACAAFRVHTYPTLVEARLKDVRAQLETKMVLLVAPTMPSNHESLFHARRRGLASLLTKLLVDDALVSSFPAVFFVNFTHITVQALTDTGTDGGGPLDAVLAFAADHGLVAAATSTPRPYSMRRLPSRSAIASYQQQRGVVNDKRKDHNDDDEEPTPVRWS